MGKERGGVAIGSHAQEDQVEARTLAPFQAERALEFAGVLGCGEVRIGRLPPHSVDIFGADGDPGEEQFLSEAVVGIGVIGWDAALVSPEDPNAAPVQARAKRF